MVTAFHSTKIPNIEVYCVVSGRVATLMKASRFAGPLLRLPALKRYLMRRADEMPEGPDENVRNGTHVLLLAEVEGPGGQCARTLLETPSGYALTAVAAVESAKRVLNGDVAPGFQTPAMAFGADFVLDLPGFRRTDVG